MKHRISAAATDGDNGMRFLSPTYWTLAQPNFAAMTCIAAQTASRTAKGSAQRQAHPYETDRQYLDVAAAHQFCA
jgi:hypothetical protein